MEAFASSPKSTRTSTHVATTLDMVANEIDGGGHVETAFFTSLFDYIDRFIDAPTTPRKTATCSHP